MKNDCVSQTNGCRLPAASTEILEQRLLLSSPTFGQSLPDVFRSTDGAITIGVDGFDADGDALTVTAVSDNPAVVPFIPDGNRYALMHFVEDDGITPIGNILLELFETRSPESTERFITLATNEVASDGSLDPTGTPYYTDVPVHRVIPDFMVQTGDAENGNGTGGSPLGTFDDQFDPDLSFAWRGALANANSGADTNDSQFFITDVPTTWLDGDHMIFGQVISGWDTYDTIINLPRDGNNRPDDTPLLQSVEILDDSPQDGTITFLIDPDFIGQANVTVTLDDGEGNTIDQVITVTDVGDRPTPDEGPAFNVAPGGSVTVPYTDDSGLPMTFTGQTSLSGATFVADDAAGEVTITAPEGFTGMFTVDVSAVEAGYDDITPSILTMTFFVGNDYDPSGLTRIEAANAIASTVVNDRLYLIDRWSGMSVFDVTDPADPQYLGGRAVTGNDEQWWDVAVVDDVAYIAATFDGILSFDVSDPANITPIGGAPSHDTGAGIDLTVTPDEQTLLVADFTDGLTLYDISDPQAADIPELGNISALDTGVVMTEAFEVELVGDTAFISGTLTIDGEDIGGIAAIDVADPQNPVYISGTLLGGTPWGMDVQDDLLYVADQNIGVYILNVADPANVTELADIPLFGQPWRIDVSGKTAVVAIPGDGTSVPGTFAILDISDPDQVRGDMLFITDINVLTQAPMIVDDLFLLPLDNRGLAILDGEMALASVLVGDSRTILDENQLPVTFSISGGMARIYTSGDATGQFEKVELFDTTASSSLTISAKGGQTTVDEFLVHDSLRSLTAPVVNLDGNLDIGGGLASLVLGNIVGDHEISIHTDDTIPIDDGLQLTMTFDDVNGPTIDTADIPIKSLTADDLANTDLSAPYAGKITVANIISGSVTITDRDAKGLSLGTLAAPVAGDLDLDLDGGAKTIKLGQWTSGDLNAGWINSLTVKAAGAADGSFGVATLTLDGDGAPARKPWLNKASFTGPVTDSTWAIPAGVGSVAMPGGATNWTLDGFTSIKSTKLAVATNVEITGIGAAGSVSATSWNGGVLVSASVKSLKTTGDFNADADVTNANKLSIGGDMAGTWIGESIKSASVKGDLTAAITLAAEADAAGKVLALGKLNVTGAIRDTQIVTAGHGGSISAGAMINSDLYIGYTPAPVALAGLPDGAGLTTDFDPLARLKTLKIKGLRNPDKSYADSFVNSAVAAPTINAASLVYAAFDNAGTPFGVTADFIKKITYKDADGKDTWKNLAAPGDFQADDPAALIDMDIRVV